MGYTIIEILCVFLSQKVTEYIFCHFLHEMRFLLSGSYSRTAGRQGKIEDMENGRIPTVEQMPKVSVIIPVYNAEKYLHQCLDSVVNQTLREIEIICVDDGSTDGSAEILKSYAENDNRIVSVRYTQNKSSNQARKDGVLMSRGTYIMFLDSDDSLELSACEELTSEMDRLGVDILQFGTFVDANSSVGTDALKFFRRFAEPCTEFLRGKDVFEGCFRYKKYGFTLWNKIYRSGLCKKAFLYVDDSFLPKAQDLYAFFILSWFATAYAGTSKKYYPCGAGSQG